MALFAKFFGRSISEGAAFAIGTAVGPTLHPIVQDLANEAWTKHPSRPLSAGTLALGVAQGQIPLAWAVDEAARTGIDGDRFAHLVDAANTGPGVPEAFDLWRRGVIGEAGFRRAAKRVGIEDEWIDDLTHVKDVLLEPSVIANAVQQGHMPNKGILPPPVTAGPPFDIPLTTIDLDPLDEAAGHGLTPERLQIATNLVGLPPGDHEMLQMWNRGIITEASVDAGIREGHRKTKWIPAVKELRFALLTGIQATNLWLRGWIEQPEALAHGAKLGYTPELMDLLYKGQGRPLSWHQVWIGLQRGGVYDGPLGEIDPAFLKALRQSSIRPEWYHLAWVQRFTLPSTFVLRSMTQAGDVTEAEALGILVDQGWQESFAAKIAKRWSLGASTAEKELTAAELSDEYLGHYMDEPTFRADLAELGYAPEVVDLKVKLIDARRVRQARQQRQARIHSTFVEHKITEDEAINALTVAGIPATARDRLLVEWDGERDINVSVLTPAQIAKAFKKGVRDRAWALQELLERNYSDEDAGVLLDET